MSDVNSPPKTPPAVSGRRQVMQAAGLVGGAFLVSRLVGLLRDVVIKYYLGVTTLEATAYDAALRFPESIFLIVAGGAIGSAFIPTFSAYFERDDAAGGWRLFSAVINLATVVTTLVAAVTFIFAEPFTVFFLNELVAEQPELVPLTVRLMRVMLLSPIIFGASGVIMGALQARQHFLLPALAPVIYNLGIIGGAILWPEAAGKEMGMAIGTVAGALGHLLIQAPGLRQKGARYRPLLTLRHAGVQQVLKLMAPRVLGLSFSEINKFVTLYLSGLMMQGSLPALNLAWRIMIMPQGILGQAMGTAAFPTLASLSARGAFAEMREILSDALRTLLFLGIPATLLLMILRQPVIVVLFERGVFSSEDTRLVIWALLFYAVGLVPLTSLEVVARTFYALNDTLTPVLAGGVQIAIMAGLSFWLSQGLFPRYGALPLGGLALGYSLSNFLEVGVLLWLLRRRLGGLNGRALLDGAWRVGLAGSVMGTAVWASVQQVPGALLQLIAGSLVAGLVYLPLCWLLGVPEINWASRTLRGWLARLKRRS